jgi:hypothetical protein
VRRCANCDHPIDEEYDQPERRPCPECGSTTRTIEASVNVTAEALAAVEAKVERGLNETRLALLGILVTVGLTVGFAVGFGVPSLLWGIAAGLVSVGLACAFLGEKHTRHYLMEFMQRLIGS